MKRVLLLGAIALMSVACEQTNEILTTVDSNELRTIGAIIENEKSGETDTRIDIHPSGGTYYHYWQAEDAIKVFNNADGSATFNISNGTGTPDAEFTGSLGGTITGAIYPAANVSAAYNGSTFTVTFPSEQTYTEGSYDKNANIYVAAGSVVNDLVFKPIMSYIKLAYYSSTSASVDSIVVTAVGGEKIAGLATVSNEGVISMDGSAVSSLRLICSPAVTLSADSGAPKYFYIALPAVEISSGLEVKVYSTISASKTFLFRNITTAPVRNKVVEMPAMDHAPLASPSTVTLTTGQVFNAAIKTLAAGEDKEYTAEDNTITKVVIATNKNMTGISGVDVSSGADGSIKATYHNGVVTIQTAAEKIRLNNNSSFLMSSLTALTDLDGCEKLWYQASNTGTWESMFEGDIALTSMDMSGLAINSGYRTVTNKMFSGCTNVTTIKLPNTAYAESTYTKIIMGDAKRMFENCTSVITISNLRSHGTGCTSTYLMFKGCASLKSLSLVNLSTRSVIDAQGMFSGCSSLTSITWGENTTFASATAMTDMFRECSSLTSLDLRGFDTRKVKNMNYMFYKCTKLTTLDMSGENCSSAALTTMNYFLNYDNKLTTLKFSSAFTLSEVASFSYTTPGKTALQSTTPLKVYCAPEFAQKWIQNIENVRTWCNNATGIQIRFYSIKKYLEDGTDGALTLSPTYGAVTTSTTVTDSYL